MDFNSLFDLDSFEPETGKILEHSDLFKLVLQLDRRYNFWLFEEKIFGRKLISFESSIYNLTIK